MPLRFCAVVIGFLLLLFTVKEMGLRRIFSENHLHLRTFEAATGDLSLCAGDKDCFKYAKEIKAWVCAADVCERKATSKKPLDCWVGGLREYSKEVIDQTNPLMCPALNSPSLETRRAVLSHLPRWDVEGEDTFVEYGAYLMALKGSAASCEDYIKNYVGAYGPQWKFKWYRMLSGCRILAHERTREQEEKDFYTWFRVVQGSGHCSDIVNSEMRKACNAPQAASPGPSFIGSLIHG